MAKTGCAVESVVGGDIGDFPITDFGCIDKMWMALSDERNGKEEIKIKLVNFSAANSLDSFKKFGALKRGNAIR